MNPLRVRSLLAVVIVLAVSCSAYAQSAAVCEQAARAAEQAYGLPQGLLLAVGQVESGRWNAQLRRVAAWPWAVDSAGQGQWFDSKSSAIAAVRSLRAGGNRNIDVGCFQINLLHHPNAFNTLDQAFDPRRNAQYAAHLLAALHAELGDWRGAVAAYHSATPDIGLPYGEKVLAAWRGEAAAPIGDWRFAGFGIRIWTPTSVGAAPSTIVISARLPQALPRVVTPSR
jgi:soluble lytic murein transglycosylase-like protein